MQKNHSPRIFGDFKHRWIPRQSSGYTNQRLGMIKSLKHFNLSVGIAKAPSWFSWPWPWDQGYIVFILSWVISVRPRMGKKQGDAQLQRVRISHIPRWFKKQQHLWRFRRRGDFSGCAGLGNAKSPYILQCSPKPFASDLVLVSDSPTCLRQA